MRLPIQIRWLALGFHRFWQSAWGFSPPELSAIKLPGCRLNVLTIKDENELPPSNFHCFKLDFIVFLQTALKLKSEYEERLRRHNYTYNMYAAFTYDATWSIALMLNKSIPLLLEKNKTLETVNYRDKEAAKIMRDILFRTDFWGMSVCTLSLWSHCRHLRWQIFSSLLLPPI